MTVKYNVIERGNPSNREAPRSSYPSIASTGRKTLRQLAGPISEISTVSSTDTMAVLEALLTVIPQELTAGNIVELGDFGNFWLKASSEGADTAEAVRATQISTLLPRFNAGKEFKKVLATVEYEKVLVSQPAGRLTPSTQKPLQGRIAILP
ncbi:MAG: HU family DNA-binding protein [Anaerolineales bacterium]|nr:HU family DNA-binding protein [Anaerolineales bacterium]